MYKLFHLSLFTFYFSLFTASCVDSNPKTEYRYIHDSIFVHSVDTLTKIDTVSFTKIDTLIKLDTIYFTKIETLLTTTELIELRPTSIKADSIHPLFLPEFMIDHIPYTSRAEKGTRYAVPGYPHLIIFDFNQITQINKLAINIFGWNEGYTHKFIIYNFSDTLATFETNLQLYSEHNINFIGRRLTLEVISGKNSWTDIGEIKFYGRF